MTPRDFEIFCAELFEKHGYKAFVTPATADGGKEIILRNKLCKHYKGSVGRPIAQKLVGAMSVDKVQNGIIITTGSFTKGCIYYARRWEFYCTILMIF